MSLLTTYFKHLQLLTQSRQEKYIASRTDMINYELLVPLLSCYLCRFVLSTRLSFVLKRHMYICNRIFAQTASSPSFARKSAEENKLPADFCAKLKLLACSLIFARHHVIHLLVASLFEIFRAVTFWPLLLW